MALYPPLNTLLLVIVMDQADEIFGNESVFFSKFPVAFCQSHQAAKN